MTKEPKPVISGPVVAVQLTGVKCDAPGCDYRDHSAPHPGETWESYLNRPCPKCGASLLTDADYRIMQGIMKVTRILNSVGRVFGLETPKSLKGTPIIPVAMRGDGSITLGPERKPKP